MRYPIAEASIVFIVAGWPGLNAQQVGGRFRDENRQCIANRSPCHRTGAHQFSKER